MSEFVIYIDSWSQAVTLVSHRVQSLVVRITGLLSPFTASCTKARRTDSSHRGLTATVCMILPCTLSEAELLPISRTELRDKCYDAGPLRGGSDFGSESVTFSDSPFDRTDVHLHPQQAAQ